MQISVIIPVYNAAKYLRRCLDSVIKSVEEIKAEILVVNNNSTDDSPRIISSYCKKYPQLVRAYNCAKWGAAAVRNMGVEKASGNYIWFVDADDEIAPDAIIKLLRVAKETGADLIMMGATKIYRDGHAQYLQALDVDDEKFKERFVRSGLGPWQVILKRKWYTQNGFTFKEGIIHEDMEMMPALILYTDKCASIDEPLYKYYETPGSVLHKKDWDPHYLDIFPALEGVYGRFQKAGAIKKYHDTLEWFFVWNLLLDSANDFAKSPEGKIGFERSRKMLKKYFPNWRKSPIMKNANLRTKIKVRLNYYHK